MSTENTEKNRWWEFYFVRYFLGTIVGGAIVLYLNRPLTSSLSNLILPGVTDVSKLDAQLLFLLLALGLAYCYIASAPILVLHAARGVILANKTKAYSWACSASIALIAIMAILIYPYIGMIATVSIVLFSNVVIYQIILLFFSFVKEGELVYYYYNNLALKRSSNTEHSKQYVESYRHLREHGNAFFILFFELLLGVILASQHHVYYVFIVITVWIFPAALVWMLGTVLEFRFIKAKHKP
jgi:hypothetical protein